MQIKVFAVLKEYFSEAFEVPALNDCQSLQQYLIDKNPAAEVLLKQCRFAKQGAFVSLDTKIFTDDIIYIMPPSSGG